MLDWLEFSLEEKNLFSYGFMDLSSLLIMNILWSKLFFDKWSEMPGAGLFSFTVFGNFCLGFWI